MDLTNLTKRQQMRLDAVRRAARRVENTQFSTVERNEAERRLRKELKKSDREGLSYPAMVTVEAVRQDAQEARSNAKAKRGYGEGL